MCSEVPRYIKVTATLGLFSDLMKLTVVNKSLSISNLMFCKESNSSVSMYYQQNEKSTQNNPGKSCIRCLVGTVTMGEM